MGEAEYAEPEEADVEAYLAQPLWGRVVNGWRLASNVWLVLVPYIIPNIGGIVSGDALRR